MAIVEVGCFFGVRLEEEITWGNVSKNKKK
jgi:hypothetical protein